TRRLNDLSLLALGMHARWQSRGPAGFLPANIGDLAAASAQHVSISDPVTGNTYGYTPLTGATYRLCAVFAKPSPADVPPVWRHPHGNSCFTLNAADEPPIVR